MYLYYYIDESGNKVYTLKKIDPSGKPTTSAHPARFTPEDKFSKQRFIIKSRFGLIKLNPSPEESTSQPK